MIHELIHKPGEEMAKEKHVPHIEVVDGKVKVSCGKDIMHPSTEGHYISWLKLYGVDKDGNFRELGSYYPKPVEEQPVAEFEVDVSNQKELHALILCNIHGLWENTLVL